MTDDRATRSGQALRLCLYVAGDTPVTRRALQGRTRLIDALGGGIEIGIRRN